MLHIVLFQPEIPQNTGNVGRLCAVTRSRLHLVHPLGFEVTDKHLKRAGDNRNPARHCFHQNDWQAFRNNGSSPKRLWLFTTKTDTTHWDADFADGDGLVFGRETSGAPDWLHDELHATRLTIPRFNTEMRALNLSTAVGVAAYEALRRMHHVPRQSGA